MTNKNLHPTGDHGANTVMEPARGKERIAELDILRGWAIFGMLIVNVWGFQSFFLPWPLQLTQVWTGTADQVALWLIDSFAAAKFWSLFCFLFGLGFAMQMKRAEARGVRFAFFYRRRLFALFLIGSVQFLLGPDSILPDYAIVGFLLLPLRNRSSKLLLIVAIVCAMVPHIREAGELRDIELRRADPQLAHELLQEEAQSEESRKVQRQHTVQVYREGSLRDVVVYNADRYAGRYFSLDYLISLLRGELPLFLLGLFIGRRQVFENIPAHLPFIRRVMWWCLCLGSLNLVVNATAA